MKHYVKETANFKMVNSGLNYFVKWVDQFANRKDYFHLYSVLVTYDSTLFKENCFLGLNASTLEPIDENLKTFSTFENYNISKEQTEIAFSQLSSPKKDGLLPETLTEYFDKICESQEFSSYTAYIKQIFYLCDVKHKNKKYHLFVFSFFDKHLNSNIFFMDFFDYFFSSFSLYSNPTELWNNIENHLNYILNACLRSQLLFKHDRLNHFLYISNIFNSISSTYYESEESSGIIQFIDDEALLTEKNGVLFDKPLILNETKIIRKLLVVSNNAILVVCNGKVLGYSKSIIKEKNIRIIHITGYLKWKYCIDNEEQFYSNKSEMHISWNDFEDFNQILKNNFTNYNDNLESFLSNEATFKKGAVLIFTNEAQKEAERLCSLNRGIRVAPFDITQNKNIFNGINQIDGALILDEYGKCYAFGIILDGEAKVMGEQSRGARFNSTKNYIYNKEMMNSENAIKYIGVVLSEDKMVNFFSFNDHSISPSSKKNICNDNTSTTIICPKCRGPIKIIYVGPRIPSHNTRLARCKCGYFNDFSMNFNITLS